MSWLSTYFPDLRPIVWHAIILKSPLLAQSGHFNFAPPRTSELSFDICCGGSMIMSICG